VQQTFKLTDEEKYLLLESDVGEGIFFAGLKHVAIKVIASYTEDQIITSDPSQILAIKKAKQDLANLSPSGGAGQLPGDTPAGIPTPRRTPESIDVVLGSKGKASVTLDSAAIDHAKEQAVRASAPMSGAPPSSGNI